MKNKIIVAVLACAMALAIGVMVGCSSSSSSSAASASGSASAASTSASAASASASAASASASAASASASAASESASAAAAATLAPGKYTVKFDTDSSMFHINEAYEGKATLSVENGEMTVHIVLSSKNIVNLYLGLAEDAAKDGAVLIDPKVEEVKYKDGTTDEVYAFDVPVPVLDEPFDLALIGTKGKWYDHKVTVSDAQPAQ